MDIGELDVDASAGGRAASAGATEGPGRAAPGQPGATGSITGNMDTMHLSDLLTANQAKATTTQLMLTGVSANLTLTGTGFTYDSSAHLKSGTLQTFDFQGPGGFNVTHISLSYAAGAPGAASPLIISWIFADATQTGFASLTVPTFRASTIVFDSGEQLFPSAGETYENGTYFLALTCTAP